MTSSLKLFAFAVVATLCVAFSPAHAETSCILFEDGSFMDAGSSTAAQSYVTNGTAVGLADCGTGEAVSVGQPVATESSPAPSGPVGFNIGGVPSRWTPDVNNQQMGSHNVWLTDSRDQTGVNLYAIRSPGSSFAVWVEAEYADVLGSYVGEYDYREVSRTQESFRVGSGETFSGMSVTLVINGFTRYVHFASFQEGEVYYLVWIFQRGRDASAADIRADLLTILAGVNLS